MLYMNRWGHFLVKRYPTSFLSIRFPRISKDAQARAYKIAMVDG